MTPKLSRGAVGCVMAVLLALAAAIPASAQQATTTGAVRGVISGPDGAPLPNATVSAINVASGVRHGAQTDDAGRFQIPFLDPGVYNIRAQRIGFRAVEKRNLRIAINAVEKLDFQLEQAAAQLSAERIVAEQIPLIEPTKTGTSTRISEQMIQDLPVNGRNFKDLVVLAPGVSDVGNTGSGGGQSIGGGRTGASNILMDGTNNNESFFAGDARGGDRAPFSYSIEAVKEIQVITAGYDVERGQFTGGTVNAVTKSGTNQFRGAVFGYTRQDDINGIKLTGKDYLGLPPTDFKSRQYGFSLGGPIIKNKAHFFVALDKQVRSDPRLVFVGGPSDAGIRASGIHPDTLANLLRIAKDIYGVDLSGEYGPLSQNTDEDAFFGRVDWQISDKHKLTVRDNYSTTSLTADRLFVSPTSSEFLSNAGNNEDQANSFVASLTSIFGRLTNEARFQWAYENKPRPSNNTGNLGKPLPQIQVQNIGSVLSSGAIQNTTIAFGADPILHFNNLEQRTLEGINNVRFSNGPHTYKLGGNWLNVHVFNFFGNNGLGSFVFNSMSAFENQTPTSFTRNLPAPGFSKLPIQDFYVNEVSVYAQDEWQYSNKLFLTYGLRYDFAWYPVEIADNPAVRNFFPHLDVRTKPEDHNNVSPRFGFTYDPKATGEQVIRGGSGIFYGRTPYVVYGNVLGATGIGAVQLSCGTGDAPVPDLASYATSYDNLPTTCLSGAAAAGGTPAVFTLDPDYQQSYAWKSNLAYDKLITPSMRAGVEMVYSTVRDNWILQDDNLNPLPRFTIEGGIPVFVDPSTINVANGSVNRVNSRRFDAFDRVGVYRSLGSTISLQSIFQVNGTWKRGSWYSSYTYDNTKDNYSRGCCTTGTALSEPRANGNPNNFNNQWGPGEFQRTHSLVLSPTLNLPWGFRTSAIFRMVSGVPWTPRYNFDINGDGQANDRIYVPRPQDIATMQFFGATPEIQARERNNLVERISNTRCIRENRGQVMDRNSCRNPGQNILDMKISKRFDTMRGQNVELVADFFNVLNGIKKEWGRRMQVPSANEALLIPAGFNTTTNRYIYRTNADFAKTTPSANFSTTQFQVQLGLRYNF